MHMLLVINYIYTSAYIEFNPSYTSSTHYVHVLPIIRNRILVLIGNVESGQFFFPGVLLTVHETGHLGAKRAAFDYAGCSGDVTTNPFYVEGNVSYYVMSVTREDLEWAGTVRDRKHIELIAIESDPTIDDHNKYIIGECNLQGYL
ncbi:hypothetical protein COBT_002786, partial [Conglomerata obtusa]